MCCANNNEYHNNNIKTVQTDIITEVNNSISCNHGNCQLEVCLYAYRKTRLGTLLLQRVTNLYDRTFRV